MQKKLSKIFILVDLLIQEIDDPVMTPTKHTKQIQDKSKELQALLDPVLCKFYENKQVSNSLFFITIQNRINKIFDLNY